MRIGSLSAQKRREELQEILAEHGNIDLSKAALRCGVSPMTIRRDLQEMEKSGLVKLVRGGAVAVEPERFERRLAKNRSAKLKIAQKLLQIIPQRGLICLDSSTTVHYLANALTSSKLTVFTTGIPTFQALQGKVGRVILSGGEVEESTGALIGPQAMRAMDDYLFDMALISMTAIDSEFGATDPSIETAFYKRQIRRHSRRVVLAADSSKLDSSSQVVGLPLDEIDILVTELDTDHVLLEPYRNLVDLR